MSADGIDPGRVDARPRIRHESSNDAAVSLVELFPAPAVKRCAREQRERADPTQYSYLHFANDLEPGAK